MKKTISILMLLFFAASITMAQQPSGKNSGQNCKNMPKIEEMVSDLSALQKRRLTKITEDSKAQIDKLQTELKKVRAQVHQLMEKDGDNSADIFPLLEREGQIRTEISKEMYRCRLAIDEVLTKEQLSQMRQQFAAERKKMAKPGSTKKGATKNCGESHK